MSSAGNHWGMPRLVVEQLFVSTLRDLTLINSVYLLNAPLLHVKQMFSFSV